MSFIYKNGTGIAKEKTVLTALTKKNNFATKTKGKVMKPRIRINVLNTRIVKAGDEFLLKIETDEKITIGWYSAQAFFRREQARRIVKRKCRYRKEAMKKIALALKSTRDLTDLTTTKLVIAGILLTSRKTVITYC